MIASANDRLLFEVDERHQAAGDDWHVIARCPSGGVLLECAFTGARARERAYEYAAWKNGGGGIGLLDAERIWGATREREAARATPLA